MKIFPDDMTDTELRVRAYRLGLRYGGDTPLWRKLWEWARRIWG